MHGYAQHVGIYTNAGFWREERKLVGVLLDTYYDPLYRHSEKGKTYRRTLEADDPRAAARKIDQWLTEGSLWAQS